MRKSIYLALSLAVSILAAAAPGAQADAPQSLSVGHDGSRHLTASWDLPGGVIAWDIEAATSPNVEPGGWGYFERDYVVLEEWLSDEQETFTSRVQLPPGVYYVHVSSCVGDCFSFPEYSETRQVTVPADPPPPPPPPPPAPSPPPAATPAPAPPPTVETPTKKAKKACAGLKGKKLRRCKALTKCKRLKGKKRARCTQKAKRVRAVRLSA